MSFAWGRRADPARWQDVPFSYPEVGASAGVPPTDAHQLRIERIVGNGPADFAAAREVILRFGMQRGAGLTVRASTETARPGTVVAMSAWFLGPIVAVCRVVYTINEPMRAGFAYGTLDGHPESGEESFLVELRPDGSVLAVVSAFSRPGLWYTRLGGPVGQALQRVIARRYLAALVR